MSDAEVKEVCGIIMPISALDGCSDGHWSDVRQIIGEAVESIGFSANLVSNADEVGIIQKRIIQNLYDNPIVVCDVSGKNPNVMFELGMRLAFDKPTIIIKDDRTTYSFDTSPIEHIEYPRDLRFAKIVEFKMKLAEKVKATYEKSTSDKNYTTFLKNFGEFKVAKIDHKEVSGQEFILDQLKEIRSVIARMDRNTRAIGEEAALGGKGERITICAAGIDTYELNRALEALKGHRGVSSVFTRVHGPGHKHITVAITQEAAKAYVSSVVDRFDASRGGNNSCMVAAGEASGVD